MATATDNTISTLNSLVQYCKDGAEGFKNAAENVKDADLKPLFEKMSAQRREFAVKLQAMVAQLGGEAETSGHVAAAVHRGLMDLKAVWTDSDRKATLNECERGEDYAVSAFKKALEDENVHEDARALISSMYADVKKSHDNIKAMRDSA
jgi:uncharacterized protein (TIGR02284 family)